ncbi:MAG: TolC family protein [Verrucomicrobiota bacterium]
MKTRLSLLAGLGLLLIAPAVNAIETPAPDVPERVDLDGIVTFALDNSPAILQARERLREQEGIIVEVKSAALPNAYLNSSYGTRDRDLVQGVGSDQSWNIALEVRQTLFSGGGVSAALDAQKYVRQSALLDLRATIDRVLLDVRTRYYDLLLARESIEVQEQNIRLLREQLETARNRFDAGSVSRFEVLRAEVELANAQPALIRARNGFRIAIDELRRVIGYVKTDENNLRKTPEFLGELEFTPVDYELESALVAAQERRPELARLAALADAREAGVRVARSDRYPDLALVGGYELQKANNSDRFRDSRDGWVIGLQSSWALFDGRATTGRIIQARSQLRQAELALAEQRLAIEVEVRRAISSLQEASELAEAAQKVVEQAEESLRLADARYSAGSATQLDVLQSRVALTQARTNQLEANYSYLVAVATVQKAIGETGLTEVE